MLNLLEKNKLTFKMSTKLIICYWFSRNLGSTAALHVGATPSSHGFLQLVRHRFVGSHTAAAARPGTAAAVAASSCCRRRWQLSPGSGVFRDGDWLRLHGSLRHVGLSARHPNADRLHRHVRQKRLLQIHQLRNRALRSILVKRRRQRR